MAKIYVVPAGPSAEKNYPGSILEGKNIQDILQSDILSEKQVTSLTSENPDKAFVWGVREGPSNRNHWQHLVKGDYLFFAGFGQIRAVARILFTLENNDLSKLLWQDEQFPLIFFLEDRPTSFDNQYLASHGSYFGRVYQKLTTLAPIKISRIMNDFETVDSFIEKLSGGEASINFSSSFNDLVLQYRDACTDTPWLKQDEIYKFKFAEWVYDRTDIENQTDEEVLEIFQESQQQPYIPGSNAKGINFILSGQRYSDSFVSLQDVRCMREMVTRGNVDSEPVEEHDITFPKLSVWLSCLDPARFKHYAFSDLHYGLSQIFDFSDNFPKKGYKAFQFAQELLNKLENELRTLPIIRDSVVGVLCDSLDKKELSKVNWAWLAQDFALYVTRNQENVMPIKRNFWWVTANPTIWDFHEKDIGETVIYTSHSPAGNKSRIYENFEHVQVGDQAIGYTASPVRVVKALLEITKGLGETEEGEGIEFKKTADLEEPISWDTIKALPEMANSQPLKTSQGSLFKLEEKEYKAIMKLVQASPDIFMSEDEFQNIVNILRMKKNIILKGPPGVGKTFISENIAYTLIGSRDKSLIETVQFHQSYSYEDFIQGYRPKEEGGFKLKNGIFFNFCDRARKHPEKKFCFIIDEINRGNLSKIFGELMLLIEKDKRGKSVVLTYAESSDDKFSIPENVYLIGTMNTADRSLAMVDYALRRRFGFISMTPQFDSPRFKAHLVENNVPNALVNKIIDKLTKLNNGISEEKKTLGSGYQIGHSYFCAYDSEVNYDKQWYKNVVIYELKPLLEEYWFDDEDKAKKTVRDLLS